MAEGKIVSAGGVSQAEVEQDFMPVILGYSCCWFLLVSWLLYAWCGTGTCLLSVTPAAFCMAAVLWLMSGRAFAHGALLG